MTGDALRKRSFIPASLRLEILDDVTHGNGANDDGHRIMSAPVPCPRPQPHRPAITNL